MSRVVIGIDPGITGAVAILRDGELVSLFDMPVAKLADGKNHVDAIALAEEFRVRELPLDARVVVEEVNAMPGRASKAELAKGKSRQTIGATSAFNFGKGYGLILGVLYTLGFAPVTTRPAAWKRAAGLIGTEKDQSRLLAKRLHPNAVLDLKKHHGRADAILIANYG